MRIPSEIKNKAKISNRFIDVIAGNGNTLRLFKPENVCIINDPNSDVVSFYKSMTNKDVLNELHDLANAWLLLGKFSNFSVEEIQMAFVDYNREIISSDDIQYMIRAIVFMNMNHEKFLPLFDMNFVASVDMLQNTLVNHVVDTLLKLKGDDLQINKDNKKFANTIETSFRAGFYEHFKNLINLQKTDIVDCLSSDKYLASWFFIKEFSKGNGLNYDKNGNIKNHYGGEEFNNKDLYEIIVPLGAPNFMQIIKEAQFYNKSIPHLLDEIKVSNDDTVCINLSSDNLILTNGKGYGNKESLIEQTIEVVGIYDNIIVMCDNIELAHKIKENINKNAILTNENDLIWLQTD